MGKAIWHKQKMLYCGTERSQRSDYDNAVHAHHAMWLPLTLTGLCDRTAWTIILLLSTSLTAADSMKGVWLMEKNVIIFVLYFTNYF